MWTLHSVQLSFVCNPTVDLAIRFALSTLKVFLKIQLAIFSFLSCSCCLVPGSFIPVLPSGSTRHLFLGVHSLGAPLATLFPVWPSLTKSPLCHATYIAGHPHIGNSQSPPGSTIFPGPFLRLLAALCSHIPVPMPLPQSSDRQSGNWILGTLLKNVGTFGFRLKSDVNNRRLPACSSSTVPKIFIREKDI
jgi:hypothetical protein